MYNSFSNRFNISTGLKGSFLINRYVFSDDELKNVSVELQLLPPCILRDFFEVLKKLDAPLTRIDELIRLMTKRYLNVTALINQLQENKDIQEPVLNNTIQSLQGLRISEVSKHLNELNDDIFSSSENDNLETPLLNSSINAIIAKAYEIIFEYDEAAFFYEKALALLDHNNYENRIEYLTHQGVSYFSINQYEKAERVFTEAMNIMDSSSHEKPFHYTDILYYLGWISHITERYERAEELYNELLCVQRNLSVQTAIDYSDTIYKLAVLNKSLKRIDEAENLYLQSLREKEKYYGNEHPLIALALNSLAIFYLKQKNFEKAEDCFLQSISTLKQTIGDQNLEFTAMLNNLAFLYFQCEKYIESERFYKQTIDIKEMISKGGSIDLSSDYYMLALISEKLGSIANYESYNKRSKEIFNKFIQSSFSNN